MTYMYINESYKAKLTAKICKLMKWSHKGKMLAMMFSAQQTCTGGKRNLLKI